MSTRRPHIIYTPEQERYLTDNQKVARKTLAKMFNKKFNTHLSKNNIKAKCTRMGLKAGHDGLFKPGHKPVTAGTKGICGQHPNSRKTQFSKGSKPSTIKPIGHERLHVHGYIMIKADIINPHTGAHGYYVLKHKWNWEQVNGKVPKGHVLRFIDGDKTNCDLDNLDLISLYENQILNQNKLNQAEPELKNTIRTMAKVMNKANEITKEKSNG